MTQPAQTTGTTALLKHHRHTHKAGVEKLGTYCISLTFFFFLGC